MKDKKYDFRDVLDSIEKAAECDNREMLVESIENIPEALWENGSHSEWLMRTFFEWVDPHFELHPIDFIPDCFWKKQDNVLRYICAISCYYDADTFIENDIYKMYDLIPKELLDDSHFASYLLSVNSFEILDDISEEFKADAYLMLKAFKGIQNEIKKREKGYTSLEFLDPVECWESFFNKISPTLSSHDGFVLLCLELDGYFGAAAGVLLEWMDEKLWLDQNFVMQVEKIKNGLPIFEGEFNYELVEIGPDEEC
jgi:hypothetical protein